jgi:hypothetical protein
VNCVISLGQSDVLNEVGKEADPVNIRAQVEYAVIAWSCSPSSANVCANVTHAGPNLGSINEVLLQSHRETD